MELIFNELSLCHRAVNKHASRALMEKLLLACKEARTFEFRHLRVKDDFSQWQLSDNYKILDWLADHEVRQDYKGLFLGLKRYPFIADDNESVENGYIQHYYYLNAPAVKELHNQEAEGLAVAYLCDTISISFATHEFWENTNLELFKREEEEEESSVTVNHISSAEHIKVHQEWLESKQPIVLIVNQIPYKEKKIKLRDDHGKETLMKVAEKLVKSSYVVEVINSLPFNPSEKQLIKKTYSDGRVEIVLNWTDKGIGLVVQTTGRNQHETKAIADIIEKSIKK
jgi:hypothetical protein